VVAGRYIACGIGVTLCIFAGSILWARRVASVEQGQLLRAYSAATNNPGFRLSEFPIPSGGRLVKLSSNQYCVSQRFRILAPTWTLWITADDDWVVAISIRTADGLDDRPLNVPDDWRRSMK